MQEIEDAAKACVCGNLRRASRAITQFYDKQLGPSGITITQLALLRTISIGNSSTISKIIDYFRLTQTVGVADIYSKNRFINRLF
jgi:DNA-binding MarR family transcriptional regulator